MEAKIRYSCFLKNVEKSDKFLELTTLRLIFGCFLRDKNLHLKLRLGSYSCHPFEARV